MDLKGAIEAGIPFCKAANGVVLSEGPIPTRFVHRIKVTACAPLGFACAWIIHARVVQRVRARTIFLSGLVVTRAKCMAGGCGAEACVCVLLGRCC